MTDPRWLLLAQKEDMQARAFRDVAKWFAVIVLAVLIGCALIPVVMP